MIKVSLTALCIALLSACGGGGGGSSSNPTNSTPSPASSNSNVVGATSQAACEQAGQDDAPACYVVEGTQAKMYGVLTSSSLTTFNSFINLHPNVTEILMVDVPGSADDEVNVSVGRALKAAGLNTRVDSNSNIASGGVDFFLAGTVRVVIDGAKIGVHAWADGSGTQAADLPRSDPRHTLYLDYYRDIGFPNFEEFYFFTLNAAPSSRIHNMTNAEIARFSIATPLTQSVTSENNGVVSVENNKQLGLRTVNIDQDNSVIITGDDADSVFTVKSGVNYIDGGPGVDTLILDGPESEYTVTKNGEETTVVDTYYERDGISILTNIEQIQFSGNDN